MQAIHGDHLRGHLEKLILSTLEKGEAHGLEILRRLEESGCGLLRLKEGSLYPALYRVERQRWITAEWGISENNLRAKFYKLTRAGRKQLEIEEENWERLARAVFKVMQST